MVRAAATGAIDFAQSDPDELWWWRRLNWIIREIAIDQKKEVLDIQHRQWAALLARPGITGEDWQNVWEQSKSLLNSYMAAVYPHLGDDFATRSAQDARQAAVDEYHAEFGKPGTPEYEEMVAACLAQLESMKRKSARKPEL